MRFGQLLLSVCHCLFEVLDVVVQFEDLVSQSFELRLLPMIVGVLEGIAVDIHGLEFILFLAEIGVHKLLYLPPDFLHVAVLRLMFFLVAGNFYLSVLVIVPLMLAAIGFDVFDEVVPDLHCVFVEFVFLDYFTAEFEGLHVAIEQCEIHCLLIVLVVQEGLLVAGIHQLQLNALPVSQLLQEEADLLLLLPDPTVYLVEYVLDRRGLTLAYFLLCLQEVAQGTNPQLVVPICV
jgi:hypothetical protein